MQISAQHCCKCRAIIVRRAGIPCTLMTLTLSCVTLGEIPRWRCAQRGWLLALRAFQSCLSALAVSFLFREPTLVPLLLRSSYELTILWHAPHSSRIHPSASVDLTSVDGTEEKWYEHLPPLDESVAAYLCPPTAIGWKARASHPSKLCRATSALAGCAHSAAGQVASALHSMSVLQVFRPRCSRMRKPVWIPPLSGTWGARQTWL